MGLSQNSEYFFGVPDTKDSCILGSVLGPFLFGKPVLTSQL